MGDELGADALSRIITGVAGPVCSGKNTVCSILEKHGFLVIDVDLLGHEALAEKKEEISKTFGPGVLNDRGDIDRSALGELVFSSKTNLSRLEQIVHPWMNAKVGEIILANPGKDIAINAAILFKMGLEGYCDSVIWVDAPVWKRLRRFMKRSGQGLIPALKRIWSQRSLKTQSSSFDTDIYDIENSGPPEQLSDRVTDILKKMRK